jgi:hypothetical protein
MELIEQFEEESGVSLHMWFQKLCEPQKVLKGSRREKEKERKRTKSGYSKT